MFDLYGGSNYVSTLHLVLAILRDLTSQTRSFMTLEFGYDTVKRKWLNV